MTTANSNGADDAARRIYAEFLERAREGETARIADLYAEYPQWAGQLRDLHGRQPTGDGDVATAGEVAGPGAMDEPVVALREAAKRYGVRGRLAQGGMGVIFRVWDGNLRRELAMKIIRGQETLGPDASVRAVSPRRLARFVREAEITAKLDHPGVVPIHELGTDEQGRVFFTMRLIQGKDLGAVFELARQGRERWTQTRVLDVIVKVCETIAFAHSRGVIHRDLKPENIMVGPFGETYVMDWGLAKNVHEPSPSELPPSEAFAPAPGHRRGSAPATNTELPPSEAFAPEPPPSEAAEPAGGQPTDSATTDEAGGRPHALDADEPSSETRYGSVLGTPSYMPPEQAAGRIDELDERSDVYSIGTILYELLSGRRAHILPGSAPSAREIVKAVLAGPPVPVAELNPRVPTEVVAICEKAMARRREDRYQNMRQMAEDLRAYLEHRVVRAYRTGAVAELQKWVSRNRGLAIATALVVLVSLGGLLAVVNVQSRANAMLSTANETIKQESSLKEVALEKETSARKAADAERRRAEGMLLARQSVGVVEENPGLALLLALESNERQTSFDANSAMLAALANHHEARTLIGHRAPLLSAAVSSAGDRVVTASLDHTAIVWDAATGQPLTWLAGHRGWVRDAKFSPDGRFVATASDDHTAALWDVRTGERLKLFEGHDNKVWHVAFSPDGRLLAMASVDDTVRIWDVATGNPRHVLRGHRSGVYRLAFSPDGSKLVSASADATARLWDVSTGEERATLEGHKGGVGVALFSPDGAAVLTTAAHQWIELSADGRVRSPPSTDHAGRLWDARTGELKLVLEHGAVVGPAAFSRGGGLVVTGAADGSVRIWNAASGKMEQEFRALDGAARCVAFSPDDRWIAVGTEGGSVWCWNLAGREAPQRWRGHSDSVRTVAFASANQVVTASHDHTARVWNARIASVVEVPRPERAEYRTTSVTISPNGQRLTVTPLPFHSVLLRAFPEGGPIAALEHDATVFVAKFSPDGDLVATLTESGDVRVWSADDGKLRADLDGTGKATASEFSGDGRLVVVSASDRLVTIWNYATGAMIDRLELAGMEYIQTSPGGRYVLAWSQASRQAEIWDTTTATRTATLPSITNSPRDFAHFRFGPDDGTLVTWSIERPRPRLHESATGRLIAELDNAGKPVQTVVYSLEGSSFATGSEESIARLWDAATGQNRAVFSGFEPSAVSVLVGPHAQRVLTRSRDQHLRLWNGRTGESVGMLGDRDVSIPWARFSADGELLLTINGKSDTAVLWDSARADRLASVTSGGKAFTDAAFSPDGRWFVTGFKDGSARVWPVRPTELAQRQVPRELTPDERDLFQIGGDQERAGYRRASNRRALARLLAGLSLAPVKSADQARGARALVDQALLEFVESLPPNMTKPDRAAALVELEQAVRDQVEPGPLVAAALATRFLENGDFPRAERLLRAALERDDLGDHSAWTSWAACSLAGLRRSAQQILLDFPHARSAAAADLKWLLERLAAGEAIRIHAGGDDFVAADGATWRHDCFFGGGHQFGESFGEPRPSSEEIHNTSDDPLYQTERWFDRERPKQQRGYQFPVPPGRYRVVLRFAEIYFHRPDRRVFDVLAEDELKLAGYDTLGAGFATADSKQFETRVDDGLLELEFRGVDQNPKVSAIEIWPLGD
ncbi:MAG TPA: malectin domain-containing carbohydrate-binding protein [Pirellulales bacterium]|nr:malectin domain-containing carbohydrate-binding protein [Pirellulales bacterium]